MKRFYGEDIFLLFFSFLGNPGQKPEDMAFGKLEKT